MGTSLIRSGRSCRVSNLSLVATKELRWQVQCRKKNNKSCLSIHNILFDFLLTVVQVSSTFINIKPKLCFINKINMSYCGKTYWNGVKSSLLTSFLNNGLADFAQNFTNERQNPTNCCYEIIFSFL